MGDVIPFKKKVERDEESNDSVLHVSHSAGKITGPNIDAPSKNRTERLAQIRASLEKIHRLMDELKRISEDANVDSRPRQS